MLFDLLFYGLAVGAYEAAMHSMARLNRNGAKLMHKYGEYSKTLPLQWMDLWIVYLTGIEFIILVHEWANFDQATVISTCACNLLVCK